MKRLFLVFLSGLLVPCFLSCSSSGQSDSRGELALADNVALSVIYRRKSVRQFLPKSVEADKVDAMVRAGLAAPSGKDTRPCHIVVVNDRNLLDQMGERLHNARMLSRAPVAFIVCGDTTRSTYWEVDAAAVAENILLAAEAMDLGAVWTASYPYEDRMAVVDDLFHLPAHVLPLCVIPVGYPSGNPRPKDKYDPAKIHTNQW
ncbi:MAG: nitroreductase family protein [Bacteroidales bacterium]|jgi:nitroreductase|nr:nitroreductase family protein [Bacteroidales bacterium]